jgi:hypothetical protein
MVICHAICFAAVCYSMQCASEKLGHCCARPWAQPIGWIPEGLSLRNREEEEEELEEGLTPLQTCEMQMWTGSKSRKKIQEAEMRAGGRRRPGRACRPDNVGRRQFVVPRIVADDLQQIVAVWDGEGKVPRE